MPDISYQMQLQNAAQNQPMQSLDTLMNSIGNTWQRREAGIDERAVVDFFTKNPATPESIQRFRAEHPQMPLMDVYKYAGAMETQKKAQGMKDKVKTLTKYISEGGELNEKAIPTLFPDATPGEIKELGGILSGMQAQGHNFNVFKAEADKNKRQVGLSREMERITAPTISESSTSVTEPGEDKAAIASVTPAKVNLSEVYQAVLKASTPEEAGKLVIKMAESPKVSADSHIMKADGTGAIWVTKDISNVLTTSGGYVPYQAPSQTQEKKLNAYDDFSLGFKAKYKKENPAATDAEISMATSTEARKLGIDKAVQISIFKNKWRPSPRNREII
jgi:hypothetical protein